MEEVDTIHKGAAAELFVMADLVGRGFNVYKNMTPGGLADVVVEWQGTLYRVQVKTAEVGEKTFMLYAGPKEEKEGVDVYAAFLPSKMKAYYFESTEITPASGNRFELPTAFHPWKKRKEMEMLYEEFPCEPTS